VSGGSAASFGLDISVSASRITSCALRHRREHRDAAAHMDRRGSLEDVGSRATAAFKRAPRSPVRCGQRYLQPARQTHRRPRVQAMLRAYNAVIAVLMFLTCRRPRHGQRIVDHLESIQIEINHAESTAVVWAWCSASEADPGRTAIGQIGQRVVEGHRLRLVPQSCVRRQKHAEGASTKAISAQIVHAISTGLRQHAAVVTAERSVIARRARGRLQKQRRCLWQ